MAQTQRNKETNLGNSRHRRRLVAAPKGKETATTAAQSSLSSTNRRQKLQSTANVPFH
jgi:hypothetical protein